MQPDDPDWDFLQAHYAEAVAEERALWKTVNDPTLHPVESVKAYPKWLAAAERAMTLGLKLRQPAASPPPIAGPR